MVRFLRRYFIDLIIVLLVVPVAIVELMPSNWVGNLHLDLEELIAICLLAVSGVAISQIKFDPERLHKGMDETKALMTNFRFFQDARIVSVQPSESPEIWDGFISDYFAINAPWLVEQASVVDYSALVETHARRYCNPEFGTAYYVFFRSGASGLFFPEAINRFRKFATAMCKQAPEAARKVKVIVLDDDAPALTLFMGKKRLVGEGRSEVRDVAIYYINQAPLVRPNGFPATAFVSIDRKLNAIFEQFSRGLVEDRIEDFMSLEEFLRGEQDVE